MREVGYRILASVPALMLDQDMGAVLAVLEGGLKDAESIEVCFSAPCWLRLIGSLLHTSYIWPTMS